MNCQCGTDCKCCKCGRSHVLIFILLSCLLAINCMDYAGLNRLRIRTDDDLRDLKNRVECLENNKDAP